MRERYFRLQRVTTDAEFVTNVVEETPILAADVERAIELVKERRTAPLRPTERIRLVSVDGDVLWEKHA
jgi:hypothetical protein